MDLALTTFIFHHMQDETKDQSWNLQFEKENGGIS
jgi:hypothetical protein